LDIFSHALWGRGLFGYRGHRWLALFFGAMPDLSSFGLFMLLRLLSGTVQSGAPPLNIIPAWLFVNYDISHSFISAFLVIGIVATRRKDLAFAMLGWPFHILLDFPFHTQAYFPVKLFWPLSDFAVDGINWGQPEIWLPNLAGLIVLYVYRRRSRRTD
jgi:hypothetical protein|tara:strand:- start:57 stop:530 length:474 start_codon:yes stop_codon:yes gene_type:complete